MMEENNGMSVFGRAIGKKYSKTFFGSHLFSTYVSFSILFPCTHLCRFCMTPPPFLQLRTYLMDGLFLNLKKQIKTFNKQLSRGKLAVILKLGKMIPIYKKGCKTYVINYRPKSRLSHLIKIIEKAVHDRLYRFLEISNAFYNYQFGFKNNYSMNHALIKIGQIRNACDKNFFTCGVNVDLQKRFHTVNHNILLIKLSNIMK